MFYPSFVVLGLDQHLFPNIGNAERYLPLYWTPYTMTSNNNSKFLWTLPYIFVAIGLLFAFMGLSEFYNVRIAGQESAYPFGQVNENQWYYQNASIYASYNLTSGLIFLMASLLTIWATIKKNKTLVILGICLTTLFFIAELISSKVQ